MRVLIIALVAGCATHHAHAEPPVAPVVAVTPAQPVYVQGLDPQLQQAVAYSAAYRAQWLEQNGAVPGAKSPVVFASGSAPASGGAVDLSAKCPKDRDPGTQAERDACQDVVDLLLLDAVGVK